MRDLPGRAGLRIWGKAAFGIRAIGGDAGAGGIAHSAQGLRVIGATAGVRRVVGIPDGQHFFLGGLGVDPSLRRKAESIWRN